MSAALIPDLKEFVGCIENIRLYQQGFAFQEHELRSYQEKIATRRITVVLRNPVPFFMLMTHYNATQLQRLLKQMQQLLPQNESSPHSTVYIYKSGVVALIEHRKTRYPINVQYRAYTPENSQLGFIHTRREYLTVIKLLRKNILWIPHRNATTST